MKKLLLFNSTRQRLWDTNKTFAAHVPDNSFVLDAGAGSSPYKSLYAHANYEAADFRQVQKNGKDTIKYVCDLNNIPVEDNRFNFIIFNQVMEHLPEPSQVLTEFNRVLKPGGKVLYTGPLFYEEHMKPFDYYRYTKFGLQYLFTQAKFEIEDINWLEGYFGTVGYQLNCMARYLPTQKTDLSLGIKTLPLLFLIKVLKQAFTLLSFLFHKLELQVKYTSKGYPKNYVAIIVKPNK